MTGVPELFTIFSVCGPGIVIVFVSNCTMIDFLSVAVADVRRFIKPVTVLLFIIFAGLVERGTGSVFEKS